jgi:hypothetical protein
MQNRFLKRIAVIAALPLVFLLATASEERPTSTFRVHVQTVEFGTPGTQVLPVSLVNPTKQIMIRAQPELSERDIQFLETRESEAGLALRITLDEHGKTVLNTATLQNQGRILVVFLNGRVVYAPLIDKTISNGVLTIPRGVFPEEIEPLRQAIKYARK